MTLQGDDCYFYYYSTCTKGDSCPFRHCEAAMGSETTCSLWEEKGCFRKNCRFRHMEIKKNRKVIACYWETQPVGCQKPHCSFHHEKPRIINGNYLAPDKGKVWRNEMEESQNEEQVIKAPAASSNPANPKLIGVKRTETQENVPSPTHPPVVINPVEDDDEDDQFSEEGEDSPRKVISGKHDGLDFGIQSLEEIKLRKALMANLKKARADTMQSADQNSGTAVEKENINSISHLGFNNLKIDSPTNEMIGKIKITDRLGKRISKKENTKEELPLKRSLAQRLGGIVGSSSDEEPQKAQKPVRERLGLTADMPSSDSDSKPPRTHKSARERLGLMTDMPSSGSDSKPLRTHKPARERLGLTAEMAGSDIESKPSKAHKPPRERLGLTTDISSTDGDPKPSSDIRIKTLEEIRHEKAARNHKSSRVVRVVKEEPQKEPSPTKATVKPSTGLKVKSFSEILHQKKKMQEMKAQEEKNPERIEGASPSETGVKAPVAAGEVKVKTLEEIRKEKAARMQAQLHKIIEDKTPSSSVTETSCSVRVNKTSQVPTVLSQNNPEPSVKLESSTETNCRSEHSRESVKVKTFEEIMREKRLRKQQEEQVTSSNQNDAEPSVSAGASPVKEPFSNKNPTAVRQAMTFKGTPSPSLPAPKMIQNTSPEHAAGIVPSKPLNVETKVKPKVNVKPSVVKPVVQSAQKRKPTKAHSAVAEVKPLNSASQAPSSPLIPKKRQKVASATSPAALLPDSPEMPSITEDSQTAPCCSEPSSTTSAETFVLPESPMIKSPSTQRSRRCSSTAARAPAVTSSSVDDFEDLLDEFTDDRLEDSLELDPGKGEDDLLLELSEMIDS